MIERRLRPNVVANRAIGRGLRMDARLEPWGPARGRWEAALRRMATAARRPVLATADVRAFYSCVRADRLERLLLSFGADRRDVLRVVSVLDRFADAGLRGLPVGPSPSAILANAMLAEADLAIMRTGARHLRWVDDVVLSAPDRATAVEALDALRRALRDAGLAVNEAKTGLLDVGSGAILGMGVSAEAVPPVR